MAQKRTYQQRENRTNYYIDGNTVRKTAPARKTAPRGNSSAIIKKRREQERQEKSYKRAQRNRQRAMYMNPGYVAFLTVCAVLVCAICSCYIYLQSQITSHISTISSLESQVLDLTSDNDEALQQIETSVDLDSIKEKAMNELGMVYPTESQIVYYSVDESDSMTQYADVEDEESSTLWSALAK